MLSRTSDRIPGRPLYLAVALLVAVALVGAQPLARAQGAKTDSALSVIPADAGFFATSLRNREQVELFYKSNAYKTLRELPIVKEAYQKAMEDPKAKEALDSYNKFMRAKDNQELIQVLTEAVSDEIFLYGNKGFGDLLRLYGEASNAQQWAPLQALLSGGDPNKAGLRAMILAVQKNRELAVVPDLVIGFKVKGDKAALAQIDRLEKLASLVTDGVPQLKGKLKKGKVGDAEFLMLDLDGSMIPWDDANLKEYEEKKDEFDDLVKHLKKQTLTVCLGVRNGYLMLGFTSAVKNLEKIGKGKTLGEREELAPLAKYSSKPLTGLSYTSAEFRNAAMGNSTGTIDEAFKQIKGLLENAPLKEDRKKAIEKDLGRYSADFKKAVKPLGATMEFSFMTESGFEGYAYDYSDHTALSGVACSLQESFGGNPLFAAAFAYKVDGSGYKYFSEFVSTVYGHGEAVGMDFLPDDDTRDKAKKMSKALLPVFKKLDDVITKELLPSMKQSGLGLVLDAKWKSKQWLKELPGTPEEMPMLELGLLLGITDAKGFESAMKNFRLTLNEIYEKGRDAAPEKDNIPEFKIPAPDSEKSKSGTLFFYPFPEEAGLDKQFLPVVGIGSKVSVVALSKGHAERLMASTPLALKSAPMMRKDAIGVSLLNFPLVVDAASPWIEFSMKTSLAAGDDAEAKKKVEEYVKQAKVGLEVLKCFKGASSATYLESGKLVTHTQVVVKDLDKAPAKE